MSLLNRKIKWWRGDARVQWRKGGGKAEVGAGKGIGCKERMERKKIGQDDGMGNELGENRLGLGLGSARQGAALRFTVVIGCAD